MPATPGGIRSVREAAGENLFARKMQHFQPTCTMAPAKPYWIQTYLKGPKLSISRVVI